MYQPHTIEASFRMFGRLPKHDVRLNQMTCGHKADEAEHGIWAAEDMQHLGGDWKADQELSPATFAVSAVWWRIADTQPALGYYGAEYLFERLTMLLTEELMPIIKARQLPAKGLRFIIEHATEDAKHATFFKHLILRVVSTYPESAAAMLRCFDYFAHVFPIPVWEEAIVRAGVEAAR